MSKDSACELLLSIAIGMFTLVEGVRLAQPKEERSAVACDGASDGAGDDSPPAWVEHERSEFNIALSLCSCSGLYGMQAI